MTEPPETMATQRGGEDSPRDHPGFDKAVAWWRLLNVVSTHSPDRVALVIDELDKSAQPFLYDTRLGAEWERIVPLLLDPDSSPILDTVEILELFLFKPALRAWQDIPGAPPIPAKEPRNMPGGTGAQGVIPPLPMKWDWLLVWFAWRLLKNSRFLERMKSARPNGASGAPGVTRAEAIESLRALACLALYALRAVEYPGPRRIPPPVDPVEFTRSLLFLVAEYGHSDLELTRRLKVESSLRRMLQCETGLYMTRSHYRDHTYHVVFVWLLGEFLFGCRVPEAGGQIRAFSDRLRNLFGGPDLKTRITIDQKHLRQNWFLTALFHDIGYPLTLLWDVSRLTTFLKSDEINALRENLQTAGNDTLSDFNAAAQTKLGCNPGGAEGLDHGIGSALYVWQLLKEIEEDGELTRDFLPAIHAIARHNLFDSEFRIGPSNVRAGAPDLENEPLSFLLVLCDELQEFGRARVDTDRFREEVAAKTQLCGVLAKGEDPLKSWRILDFLLINVEPRAGEKVFQFTDSALDFGLLYRQLEGPEESYLAIWLLRTRNLQRVAMPDESKLNVTVRCFWSESKSRWASFGRQGDLEVLANFVRAREEQELERWIEEAYARRQAIWYDPARPDALGSDYYGQFVIHLNRLSRRKLLIKEPNLKAIYEWLRSYPARARFRGQP